jgi:hypothetical protein
MEKRLNYDSEGNYHDDDVRLERQVPDIKGRDITAAYQRVIRLHNLTAKILQSIIAESPYKTLDMAASVFDRVYELEENNMLPDGITAEELMQTYYKVWGYED